MNFLLLIDFEKKIVFPSPYLFMNKPSKYLLFSFPSSVKQNKTHSSNHPKDLESEDTGLSRLG